MQMDRSTTDNGDSAAATGTAPTQEAMATNRRGFLKLIGVVGAAGATGAVGVKTARAESHGGSFDDTWAMLTDLTLCIGCRKCEFACKQTNGFPTQPLESFEDKTVFEQKRRIAADDVTFVNRFEPKKPAEAVQETAPAGSRPAARQAGPDDTVYVKRQCMHCNEPACVSACPVGAIRKTAQGPVVYRARKCIGCRYCMMACPFSMLGYTYDDPLTPVVRKCSMCFDTIIRKGGVPACVKICPVEAITFGRRGELIALARERIRSNPDRYVDHIYGESEVGGTSVLYVAPRGFDELGFRTDLGTTPLPELSGRFMSIVPFVVTAWPAVLLGVYSLTKRRKHEAGQHSVQPGHHASCDGDAAKGTKAGPQRPPMHGEGPAKGA